LVLLAGAVLAIGLSGISVLAFASVPDGSVELETAEGAPAPEWFGPGDFPTANPGALAQLEEAAEEQRLALAQRGEWLESAEAREERVQSKVAHRGLTDAAALDLLRDRWADVLRPPLPDAETLVGQDRVVGFLDDGAMRVEGLGGRDDRLVLSEIPLRVRDESGARVPTDVDLAREGDEFVPESTIADISVPVELEDGATVDRVAITPAGDATAVKLDGDTVAYPNADLDTDVALVSTLTGLETFHQLRSDRAPEQLRLDVELPAGAALQPAANGAVVAVRDGEVLASISAPTAVDAQGEPVPAQLAIDGSGVVIEVDHQGRDVAYPILVDPFVEEDWAHNGTSNTTGTWFHQNEDAIPGLLSWSNNHSANVADNLYAPRLQCYLPVSYSCYSPYHDGVEADGLHMMVRANTSYPAASWGQWYYTAPGYSTRINRVDWGAMHLRPGGTATYPFFFYGIYSHPNATYITQRSFSNATAGGAVNNVTHDWFAQFAGTHAGPQSLVAGWTNGGSASNVPYWRDGYIGGMVVQLTDPDQPTNLSVTKTGPTGWTSDGEFTAAPEARDAGVGMKSFTLRVPSSAGTQVLTRVHPCSGRKGDECPSYDYRTPPAAASTSWKLPDPSIELEYGDDYGYEGTVFDFAADDANPDDGTAQPIPDGISNVVLEARDIIHPEAPTSTQWQVKVDRIDPAAALSGALWDAREQTPPPSGGQPVLSAGTHALTVNATDPAPAATPSVTRSGVEKVDITVDGDSVHSSNVPCGAGNCARTVNWSFDTAQYGGRHTIEVTITDGTGNAKTETFVVNAPARGQLVYPDDGETTSGRLPLQAKANEGGFTGVEFQYRQTPIGAWTTVDSAGTSLADDRGVDVTTNVQALSEPNRHTKKLIWDPKTALALLNPKPGPIQLRAVFTGNGTFKSQPVNAEIDEKGLSAGNAAEAIGPGSVDLLTGNFSYTATDAAVAGFSQGLSMTRTFNSTASNENHDGPFGAGWTSSAPVAGVAEYASLSELTTQGFAGWVDVEDAGGVTTRFEKLANGDYKSEAGAEALKLVKVSGIYKLTDLDGTTTTFTKPAGSTYFVPSEVSEAAGSGTDVKSGYTYEVYNGTPRLKRIVAPGAPGLNCTATTPDRGCKVLQLNYSLVTAANLSRVTSISHIAWDPVTAEMKTDTIAQFSYEQSGRLYEAWDPRLSILRERYAYDSQGRLATITPPGLSNPPWSIAYVAAPDANAGKLASVSRTVSGSGLESWRTTWGVPLSGAGAPYAMSATDLDAWGQTDRPTDATAILPPDQAGGGFSRASVYYLNANGQIVNTATPGDRITTAEYDAKGNVVRELSAAGRAKALAVGGGSATLAGLLSTYSTYSTDGLELTEQLGPQHEVKLDSGQVVDARAHTVTSYDEDSTLSTDKAAHLPTTVSVGAKVDGSGSDEDVRVTKTEYDWTLRKPTKTIADATSGGLNVTDQTAYNAAGLETESRQPKSNGSDAGTTKTVYYTHDGSSPDPACRSKPEWFNLPCKTLPAAQPGTAGLPDLPVTTYQYNRFGQVTVATEQVGSDTRTTTTTYDSAGRHSKERVESTAGVAVEESTTSYNVLTGRPSSVSTPSGTITTGYDNAGRVTSYTDADGVTSTTSYDNLNRAVTTGDGKGTQTRTYVANTGLLSQLVDSHAGTFTASYDADGRVVARGYPNGMTGETTYDDAGAPIRLKYTKTTNCSSNCTWIDEQVSESIHGQWRTHDWELSSQEYTYDEAGRLTEVVDDVHAPAAVAGCAIRSYAFDANSNRTQMMTKQPGSGGACQPGASGTQQPYSYDSADRLTGSGLSYDSFGRMTSIPAQYAGGEVLAYSYYVNDQVRTISQDGISKTYSLDPIGRQRQTVATGGTSHNETLHYQDGSDAVSWSRIADSQGQEVSWERNIEGIDGDLAAIRTHDGQGDTTVLQLPNLHGDIIATASTDPQAMDLTARFETDEFGNPRQTSSRRFGWLGGKQRRTELSSGAIQMGVRSYLPTLGKFTSVDLVRGGSATSYDYGNADPINQLDLNGLKSKARRDPCTMSVTAPKAVARLSDDDGTTFRITGSINCTRKKARLTVKVQVHGSGFPNLPRNGPSEDCHGVRSCEVTWDVYLPNKCGVHTVSIYAMSHGTYRGAKGKTKYPRAATSRRTEGGYTERCKKGIF
jgi:RHS repeat-associated protein